MLSIRSQMTVNLAKAGMFFSFLLLEVWLHLVFTFAVFSIIGLQHINLMIYWSSDICG